MTTEKPKRISVASWNVLAEAYLKPEFYPLCDPASFVTHVRYPKIVECAVQLRDDVMCFQEVDAKLFNLLSAPLSEIGYEGFWTPKGRDKPDGCATFTRLPWRRVVMRVLSYDDGRGTQNASGHIAQILTITRGDWTVTVVNTHLKWDSPDTPQERRLGLLQATELLANGGMYVGPAIICGDFNADPDSDVLGAFAAKRFSDAHRKSVYTANANGVARKIDYILHSSDLEARAFTSPMITGTTPLPSGIHPSDHVPLRAAFAPMGTRKG